MNETQSMLSVLTLEIDHDTQEQSFIHMEIHRTCLTLSGSYQPLLLSFPNLISSSISILDTEKPVKKE